MKLKGTLREQLEQLDQRETELLKDIENITRELLFYKSKDHQRDVRATPDRPSSKQYRRRNSDDDTDSTTTTSETGGRSSHLSQSKTRPSSKDKHDDKKKIEVCFSC
jgi:hypothetical protein